MTARTTLRLLALFGRSRRTMPALGWLAGVAALAWYLLGRSDDRLLTLFLLMILPLGPAVVVGASAASPFGDIERAASAPLPALRLAHLVALLGVAALLLTVANGAVAGDDTAGMLVRNGAGYAGLALLGGWLAGPPGAWAAPLAYGALAWFSSSAADGAPPAWAWAWYPVADHTATLGAAALCLVGLAASARWGMRDTVGNAGGGQ